MTQGFYTHTIYNLILYIKNYNLNTFEAYEVNSNMTLRRIKYFFASLLKFLMPFDHYPSLEELQQLPELFI